MENQKPTEDELNAWIEKVHFGSCCSDSVESPDSVEANDLLQTEKERSDK
ncbi:hypothetical protein [Psychromonas ingrahamii]|nr:hypothetical protein [Psychromonas ingrahamii]